MASETVRLAAVIAASPERIFAAWMSSEEQAVFTGAKATIDPVPGGSYTAYDGYMRGLTLEALPGKRIIQTFRTDEFPGDVGDSKVIVELEPVEGGTRVVLTHEDVPEGMGARYEKGWREYYLDPIKKHLEAGVAVELPRGEPAPEAPRRKAARQAKAAPKKRAQRTSRKPAAKKPASSRSTGARKASASRKPARSTRATAAKKPARAGASRKVKVTSRTVKRTGTAGKAARASKASARGSTPPRKPARRKR